MCNEIKYQDKKLDKNNIYMQLNMDTIGVDKNRGRVKSKKKPQKLKSSWFKSQQKLVKY